MTLTKRNGGREGGREGRKVGCVTKGGSGGPPPEKKNLDPLRLILMQFEGQKSHFITNHKQTYIYMHVTRTVI